MSCNVSLLKNHTAPKPLYKSTTFYSLELWLYLKTNVVGYWAILRKFIQHLHEFQETRKGLVSHSSTFSFFSNWILSAIKEIKKHYSSFDILNIIFISHFCWTCYKKIHKGISAKTLSPVWCGPSKPCLFQLLQPVFFVLWELWHPWFSLAHVVHWKQPEVWS